MIKRDDTVTINLDGKSYEVDAGLTILEAAEQNGVYIPTLCAHGDLMPFGACRMCLVEVEGMRGFPTACTTPVQHGMTVRTDTDKVRELRLDVLRLTLSQHTCGCIVCVEGEECKAHSGTVRKAGVTTGCRTCPSDGTCELQEIAERVGLKEINLPVYYRTIPVEKYDPFYDRDYNLCILCGRCVRICQDLRAANTLAFQRRGGRTVIGPAYGRTHLESGCEFCGSCVSACPTGALSEKVRKWDGEPDGEEVTTCPLCGLGCQVRLLIKNGRVIGSLPADDPVVNDGQLCVKGRFCFPEIVNDYRRLRKPYRVVDAAKIEIRWDKAISQAAEKLAACRPERFAMLVSPNCTNEDLYIAQKFARVAMRSNNIDTTARVFYGVAFKAYLDLMKHSASLSDIRKASVVLSVGLDTRLGRSVVGVELRKAIKRGAKVVTIHPERHSLSFMADAWLRPDPDLSGDFVESLLHVVEAGGKTHDRVIEHAGGPEDVFATAARLLSEAFVPLILVGPEAVHHGESAKILGIIEKLARVVGARVLVLPAQNNLFGSILMGAYPELLPGGFASSDRKRVAAVEKAWGARLPELATSWTADSLSRGGDLDVLYLVGEVPSDGRPPAGYVIFQNVSPPVSSNHADLVLPAAAFTEVDGTFLSGEGRIQRVKKAVDPPGEALPDWVVLCRIAQEMGVEGFGFNEVGEVHREIADLVRGFGDFDALDRETVPFVCEGEIVVPGAPDGVQDSTSDRATTLASGNPDGTRSRKRSEAVGETCPFVLTASVEEHTYRGFPISTWVAGAKEIFPEGCLDISPGDAERAQIQGGDEVVVWSAGFERKWRARIVADQSEGSLRVKLRGSERLVPNPRRVNMRKSDV